MGRSYQANFKMLIAEVIQELEMVRAYIDAPSPSALETIKHRVAFVSTLSLLVQNQSFDRVYKSKGETGRLYRGLSSISSRLHRIADLGHNIVRQLTYFTRPDFLNDYRPNEFFEEILAGLNKIGPALSQKKVGLAVLLCRSEAQLDRYYADRFRTLSSELRAGRHGAAPEKELKDPGDLITALMIIHYLERIGDIVLEIGEQIIYILMGEKLKFTQYQALGESLRLAGRDLALSQKDFHSIWSGRSGCRIGLVSSGGGTGTDAVVFKHGPWSKLIKEKENLELWEDLRPHLPPRIKAFVPAEAGEEASLVLEFIPDSNLKDLFQQRTPGAARGVSRLLEVIAGVWRDTMAPEPARAGFTRQAEKRLGGVRALYPHQLGESGCLGNLEIKPVTLLLSEAAGFEEALKAPFSVRIHGDFNLSNILYDPSTERLHVLDLYRSQMSDYVQDVSVLLMSLVRLPLYTSWDRSEIWKPLEEVRAFGRDFASAYGDRTYEARLAFGLARGFLTSARFETHKSRAARFIRHSRYLWERINYFGAAKIPWEDFTWDRRALYL